MRERHALISLLCCAGLALGLGAPSRGAADDKFSIENLAPAPSQRTSIISVYGTETRKRGEWELNALMSYARRPLSAEDKAGNRIGDLVGSVGSLNLMATFGLADWLDFSLALPFHRTSEGAVIPGVGRKISLNDNDGKPGEADVGVGDLRLVPRARLIQRHGLGIALVGSLFLPTGKDGSYMSEAVRVEPRLAIDYKTGDLRFAANIGYMFRKQNDLIPGNQIDDAFTWGAGLDAPLVSVLHAVAEVDGWLGVASDNFSKAQAPIEWRVGPRIVSGGWLAQAGAGTALLRGIGAPSFRLYASVGYSGIDLDKDGDGILDSEDACPDAAEDRDGFNDADGCPDLDNDNDGVPDAKDGAPNDPEDLDGFNDADGVPDLDNDNDGVPDLRDGAPLVPEDMDGFEDTDGIPEPDNDQDGIGDLEDKCPLVPGLREDEGCPIVDSDTDGLPDRDDKCPRDAGPASNGGCPLVQVTAQKLELSEMVYFKPNMDEIEARSFPLLDAVASALKEHPEVLLVSVDGHTDSTGVPRKNLALSKRRAASVVKYLVEKGVEPGRLKSTGSGQTQPIAPNDTEEGRSKNRRVEFTVAKRTGAAGDEAAEPEATKPAPAKSAPAKPKAAKPEATKPEAAKPEPTKPEATKPEPAKPAAAKPEAAKPAAAKPEPAKPEPAKPEPAKPEPAKSEPVKPEAEKPAPAKPEPAKPEAEKPAPAKSEPVKPEAEKPAPAKPEPAKPEAEKPAPAKPEPAKAE